MEIAPFKKYDQTGFTIIGKVCSLNDYQKLRNFYNNLKIGDTNLIIDLSRMTFSSSRGLSFLVEIEQTLKRNGKKLFLLNPREEVGLIIELLGIDRIITIVKTPGKNSKEILLAFNNDCPQ